MSQPAGLLAQVEVQANLLAQVEVLEDLLQQVVALALESEWIGPNQDSG